MLNGLNITLPLIQFSRLLSNKYVVYYRVGKCRVQTLVCTFSGIMDNNAHDMIHTNVGKKTSFPRIADLRVSPGGSWGVYEFFAHLGEEGLRSRVFI